jgi:hypothetical protein
MTESSVVGSSKPRARLGPTEIVQLSDSEPENDEVMEGVETAPNGTVTDTADFLADYPENTDVSRWNRYRVPQTALKSLQCSLLETVIG